MMNYSAYKIPVYAGVNDDSIAPNSSNSCNGSYVIQKHNELVDLLFQEILALRQEIKELRK